MTQEKGRERKSHCSLDTVNIGTTGNKRMDLGALRDAGQKELENRSQEMGRSRYAGTLTR